MSDNEDMIKYPETLSLRRLHDSFRKSCDFPTRSSVAFRGTVKLHGSNTSVVLRREHAKVSAASSASYTFQMQSRNRIITPMSDNMGFAVWVRPHINTLAKLCFGDGTDERPGLFPDSLEVVVVGEWAGKGIQKNVGIAELPRFWSVFAVRADGLWLRDDSVAKVKIPEARLFNVYDFQTWTATIDFSLECDPAEGEEVAAIAREVETLTLEVESECPAALALGGVKNGVGEGIVWTEIIPADTPGSPEPLKFKTKGPKHRMTNKKPNLGKGAVSEDKKKKIEAFVRYAVTTARLDQGLDYLREMNLPISPSSTGQYLKWVCGDVEKEETLVLDEMGLERADVQNEIIQRAKEHFRKSLKD